MDVISEKPGVEKIDKITTPRISLKDLDKLLIKNLSDTGRSTSALFGLAALC
jgi:hypothetical protein